MNIYDFFNSKDISEYCKNINHKFTAIEMAYIVWHSNHHTLNEKHRAWKDIISTMPDEQFHPYWDMEDHTLHSFLRIYMQLQNEYIEDFYKSTKGYIYTCETLNFNDDVYRPDEIFYNNYEACLSALKKYTIDDDTYNELVQVKIIRHKLYAYTTSFEDAEESEAIIFNRQLDILNLETMYYDTSDERRLMHGFYNMWVAIPVPFQKGDIVTISGKGNNKPFVLELVPWWRRNKSNDNIDENREYWLDYGVDGTDMDTCGWFQDDSGELYWNHKYCYLDLEYCHDELEGIEKFLIAFSNCIKGSLSIENLLRSHSIFLTENYAKEMRKYFYYSTEELSDCGIGKY